MCGTLKEVHVKKLVSLMCSALIALAFVLPAAAAPQPGSMGAKPEAPFIVAAAKADKAKPVAKSGAKKAKSAKDKKAKAGPSKKAKKAEKSKKANPKARAKTKKA